MVSRSALTSCRMSVSDRAGDAGGIASGVTGKRGCRQSGVRASGSSAKIAFELLPDWQHPIAKSNRVHGRSGSLAPHPCFRKCESRPKSDRLAPKVLALVAPGRSYRLIGRELGLYALKSTCVGASIGSQHHPATARPKGATKTPLTFQRLTRRKACGRAGRGSCRSARSFPTFPGRRVKGHFNFGQRGR